jgi:NADP-dependent aldehyde dehydrogenase
LHAGRAISDAAARRPEPIPVFAEMGSVNPVFVLPGALAERKAAIAAGLVSSVTLGAGQFCTNPGLVFGQKGSDLSIFAAEIAATVEKSATQTLLHDGIRTGFEAGVGRWTGTAGVRMIGSGPEVPAAAAANARAAVFTASATTFLANPHLHEEVFGPVSLLVEAEDRTELYEAAEALRGNLTATIHGTPDDLAGHSSLIRLLERKVGRIIFNGFPTGVEVCPSMHHGGPWPASSDARSTSVGTAAVFRFARPICYQDFPDETLPTELQVSNPDGIYRLVDGTLTRDAG